MPVTTRRNARAKRMSIRVDQKKHKIFVTLPRNTSLKKAEIFAHDHIEWLQQQICKLPPKLILQDQSPIPILGKIYYIHQQKDKLRGLVSLRENQIIIPGFEDMLESRLNRFLKKHAQNEITKRAEIKADKINATIHKITLKDTKTRWGSCSSAGDLAFSWRLIMAPDFVFDYVIAHEVAHLQFMNHGASFWQLCYDLTDQGPKAKKWLKANGHKLYHYQN